MTEREIFCVQRTGNRPFTAEGSPVLWVVILNWNQRLLTAECLQSLRRSTYKRFHTIVVDNGSDDRSADVLRREFPEVILIENASNLGFAGGNNVGIRASLQAGAEYILLLNNDTEVAEDFIEELLRTSAECSEYSLFCPKIYLADNPNRLWYAGGDIDLRAPMGVIHAGIGLTDQGQYDERRSISFVTGCAFMARRDVWESVGLLDERLYAYCEDLDLCLRAKRLGHRALYVPSARLWHKVGRSLASDRGRDVQLYLVARSRFIVQRQYGTLWHWLWFVPWWVAGHRTRRVFAGALCGDRGMVRAWVEGVRDGLLPPQSGTSTSKIREKLMNSV